MPRDWENWHYFYVIVLGHAPIPVIHPKYINQLKRTFCFEQLLALGAYYKKFSNTEIFPKTSFILQELW